MGSDSAAMTGSCPHFDHHDTSLTGDDYFPIYAGFRERPVSRSDAYGGFWIISRYDDVRAALKDNETFASGQGCFLPPMQGFRSLGLESDPPEHGFFRKLFLGLAGRPAVLAAEDKLVPMVRRIVDDFAAGGGGDAILEVSEKLPVEGIALMAGLSPETASQVRELTVAMWKRLSTDPDATVPLMTLLMAEVEVRRQNGRDDFLTDLAKAEYEGRPMTDDEIGNVLLSAVVAGHETTMNASSNLMLELASRPALQERLRESPDLIPATVDEALRHRAPVHLFFRTVTRETEFAGTEMRAGEKVAIFYASANRDPDRFDDPEVFDVDRGDSASHVSFGWGIHRCVGAPLAQSELRMLTEELLSHGAFELVGPPAGSHLEGGHHLGWRSLPLRFVS